MRMHNLVISFLKIYLVMAISFILPMAAYAGDTTVAIGDIYTEKGNELFLSLRNTEASGHDYRLVSAGSLGGIGTGKFGIYDATPGIGLTRLTIDTAGNVGIGTTTPGVKIDVYGDGPGIRALDNSGPDVRLYAGDTEGYIGTFSNHDLRLRAGGNDWMSINYITGDVCIGIAGPGAKLDVSSETGTVFIARDTTSGMVFDIGTAGGWVDNYLGRMLIQPGNSIAAS